MNVIVFPRQFFDHFSTVCHSLIHDEIKSSHQTNLVKLQGHFDKMFGYIVSPTDQDVVGIDNFPFLQKSKSVSRKSKQCDKLTKLRVFIARYTSFMMSWGLLCDRIPKCHLALLIGLPRWVFSVVGLMPSTTARSRKAAKCKISMKWWIYCYQIINICFFGSTLV